MPVGVMPTGMVATTNPSGALASAVGYAAGNGGFIFNGIPLPEPLKMRDEPLPVNTLILNWFAVGQSATVDVKLQSTFFVTVNVPVVCVGVGVDFIGAVGVVVWSLLSLWLLNPFSELSLP
jgi:hypothetical protein